MAKKKLIFGKGTCPDSPGEGGKAIIAGLFQPLGSPLGVRAIDHIVAATIQQAAQGDAKARIWLAANVGDGVFSIAHDVEGEVQRRMEDTRQLYARMCNAIIKREVERACKAAGVAIPQLSESASESGILGALEAARKPADADREEGDN